MLKVYLAGEIHTNWREEIIENCKKENLDIQFSSPVTDHPSSDDCGIEILGLEFQYHNHQMKDDLLQEMKIEYLNFLFYNFQLFLHAN